MRRAFVSEWSKLRRPGIVLGGAGTMVGVTLLVTIVLFSVARPASEIGAEAAANAAAGTPGRSPGFPLERLTVEGGFVVPLGLAAQLIGVVALVLYSQNLGNEYGQGTLKVLLAREPRRLVLLGGKLLALGSFTFAATLVACLLGAAAAILMAKVQAIDTTAWWSAASVGDACLLVLRVGGATLAWGALGAALAIVLRAAPAAIGIGIGYTVVGEPILAIAAKGAAKYLPGQAIQAFTGWGVAASGNEALSGPAATVAVALYAVVALVLAAQLFARRDVTG